MVKNSRQGKGGGPKDTRKTRFNALRHGIFTHKVFLSDAEREEFGEIKEEITSTFNPNDLFEAMLVDRICLYALRLQRCTKADSEVDSSHGIYRSVRPRQALNRHEKHLIQRYERFAERSLYRAYHELIEYKKYLKNQDSL